MTFQIIEVESGHVDLRSIERHEHNGYCPFTDWRDEPTDVHGAVSDMLHSQFLGEEF